ncbi:MAG: hypothetical protein IT370_05925 [Deltaproteobacteria bacterium]|nr:hypothetical protein [Deltaproteobacteria bacterium]
MNSGDYQKMVDEQAAVMGVMPCPVKLDDKGSAATDRKSIFINPSFASKVAATAGVNGIRFVLAHELGHARGGADGGHSGEFAADQWATQSLVRAGIGAEPIEGVMSMLPASDSKSHPGANARADRAVKEWHSMTGLRPRPMRSFSGPARRNDRMTPIRPHRFRER